MSSIEQVVGREVLDSRGNPTVEADVLLESGVTKDVFEQFLSNVSLCRDPLSFELVGTSQAVVAQFAAHLDDAPSLRRPLQAHFPEATFQSKEGTLDTAWDASNGDEVLVVEFGLEREFMFPLSTSKLDPFVGIIGALAELRPGELGLFQVIFQPTQQPWDESILRSVCHADGSPFFVNTPELTDAAKQKTSKPLYGVVVRILVRSERQDRTLQMARDHAITANPVSTCMRWNYTSASWKRCCAGLNAVTS